MDWMRQGGSNRWLDYRTFVDTGTSSSKATALLAWSANDGGSSSYGACSIDSDFSKVALADTPESVSSSIGSVVLSTVRACSSRQTLTELLPSCTELHYQQVQVAVLGNIMVAVT